MTMYKKIFIFHLMMIVQRVAVSGQDCNKPADLYFVIDGSESVSDTDFKTTKNVLVEVLRSFNVSKDNVHVGANVFGRTVYDRIVLYGPSRSMYVLFETRLRSLSRTSQPGTATYLAIEEMRSDFRTYGRNVTKIAVVITDGKSADSTRTYEQARLAREAGVTMVAIGVGDVNEIFVPELNNIASSQSLVFTTQNITRTNAAIVSTLVSTFKNIICPKIIQETYYHLPMDQIFNRAIVNPSKLEARITGNAQLTSGVLGNALKIDASQSYVTVASANHRQECFGNLGLCPNGYTIAFWVFFETSGTARGVYLSNGGESASSHGVAMFYENGRMQWVFRTQSGKEWRVYGNHMLTGRWYHVTVTWQAETGLKMMVNGQMVDRQTLFVQSTPVVTTAYNDFIIGQSNSFTGASDLGIMLIDEFQFWSTAMTSELLREKGPIYFYYLLMDGITNGQVVASNIYSTGKGALRIVSGVVGNALDFSMGSGKYVDMGTFESSCIGNPSLCTFGLSISFWLRFISGQTNAYVFSNNASGLAVYLNGSTLNASIQKGGQRWFVSASGLINESWYFVEVTWHPNSGLGLYLNQSMASSQVSGTVVTQGATGSANLYLGQIGGNMSNRSNAMMTIDDLYIYNADRQQLLNINYIIRGKPRNYLFDFEYIETHGGAKLVPGIVNNALRLDGTGQWAEFTHVDDGCLGNLDFCHHGVLLRLWISFGKIDNGMVYLSSAVNGITLSVVNGMFRISAETTTRLWEIILSPVQVNKWFYFEINWTEMFGLQLFIDGVLIRSEVAGIDKTLPQSYNASAVNNFFIGTGNGVIPGNGSLYGSAIYDEMEYWEASRDYIMAHGYFANGPTTAAPGTTTIRPVTSGTTPETDGLGAGFDCPECMIDNGHGFTSHPKVCKKYIEIIADTKGNRTYLTRKCRDGLFWDQYKTTCRRPEDVNCPNDPCKTMPIISYEVDDNCAAYILCAGGRSVLACCPIGHRYKPGSGCVKDPTCTQSCIDTDDGHILSPAACDKRPFASDRRYYIQSPGVGHADIKMPCPPGTLFNAPNCMCDIVDTSPPAGGLGECDPSANFTFAVDATDVSGNHAYAGTELVDFIGGTARFYGNGMINIYRFSMDDFSKGLVMRIIVTPSSLGNNTQALVTNCVYSSEQRSSVSIRLERGSSGNMAVFSTDTTLGNQNVSVPYTVNAVNEIVYIYDGSRLTGIVNGNKQQRPLQGGILLRRSGLIIGAGSNMPSLIGSVDEFQVYKECFPAFAETARTP